MKFKKYSATQLFSQIEKITESSFKNEKRICEFPFNLNFSINKNYNQKKEFSGPGIYILTFKQNVIYIGSYASRKSEIINERWKKHIMTMTNRGYRIGFSSKTKRSQIPKNIKSFFEKSNKFRYYDTGTVTTIDRLTFADSYSHIFKSDDNSILSDFNFYYMQISKCSSKDLKKMEKKLIEKFSPRCNFLPKGLEKNTNINCNDVISYLEDLIDNTLG
jgi:hypothetical protein